jgi:alkylation response protein AidB-like acyl-CoA dehydrogenase
VRPPDQVFPNEKKRNAMYDLHLSEEQIAIRDTVRDFVNEQIKPVTLTPARLEPFDTPVDLDLVRAASELGLRTLALSEDAGGAGVDTLTCCLVAEELAAGDTDIAAVLSRTAALGGILFNDLMNDAQRAAFQEAFVEDPDYHLALADQEPDADNALGVHYHREDATDAPVTTSATRDGGNWVVNGSKVRIANAPLAKLFAVTVDTGSGPGVLLVPADTDGVTVTPTPRDGGWFHGAFGDVTFKNCTVPADYMLRPEAVPALSGGNCEFGLPQAQAVNLGVGRAAYEAAVDYSGIRVQGGKPIIEHQAIGAKLADVAISLEVVRDTIWHAAWVADNPSSGSDGNFPALPRAIISQVVTAEKIYRAAKDAAECFGAMGVMRDMPAQKYIHDARVFLHSGSGVSDARLRVAEALAGFRRS